ncbi:MAG: twin-arginine translocation pathway signal protein [Deltaproteobacteria bacterium]|nr:twin-arginine translocation pathway signal protein [Deltaproteobacteria bacterium]MBW2404976.1 twin-arginine translocation pathway signal protein [Deltaproteobacteria bacterium]MBW2548915.1 twin-arginine translocation pathway signal protein [Deltaproteobacteria bacterium]MBW2720528.1 twin-arginine translocation pathway signal protein [Deltaproteobacteria bacterium]RLB45685.1 MAG: twin-arginine translocation pathway signal protein [Deltaproteobacteria bacterium]
MPTDRREFLKLSMAGAAALSTMSAGATLSGCTSSVPASGMKILRPEDVELLRALTPAVMKGKIAPTDTAQLDQTLQSFDTLLVDLSEPVVIGVLQAFDVLNMGLTRGLTTGQWSAWSKASLEDAESALARLRDSGIGLLNAIYAAVIRLIASSWYLIPENALTTGYPGPPKKVAGVVPAAPPAKEAMP